MLLLAKESSGVDAEARRAISKVVGLRKRLEGVCHET